jgi:hypothetical protein
LIDELNAHFVDAEIGLIVFLAVVVRIDLILRNLNLIGFYFIDRNVV